MRAWLGRCCAKSIAAGLLICGALLASGTAHAHWVAAQSGTLNMVDQAAFLVLSVPVSALQGVDEDQDGNMSKAELARHDGAIRQQIQAGIQMMGPDRAFPLQLVMVDIAPADNTPESPASHLVVLGRFDLNPHGSNVDKSTSTAFSNLELHFSLFGQNDGEQTQDLTITRQSEKQWLRFTTDNNKKTLFPSSAAVFSEYVRTGASHVLSGADHLLFLLVVLSACWRLVALVGALTCFTAGHAITLAACVWGGFSVSEQLVEPAIAATIVGMAAFDVWTRRRAKVVPSFVRLLMVFVCALVHGLGLAGALSGLTQWPTGSSPFIFALAGFNLGIELAQISVAVLASFFVLLLNRSFGSKGLLQESHYGSVVGMMAGTFWFIERVVQGF